MIALNVHVAETMTRFKEIPGPTLCLHCLNQRILHFLPISYDSYILITTATTNHCPVLVQSKSPAMSSSAPKGRLVVVSNRLPVSIKDTGQGRYELKPSSGGLVTGLRGLANTGVEFLWFGWPGLEIPKENASLLKKTLLEEHKAIPVLLPQHTSQEYYNGFSSTHVIVPTMINILTT